MGIGRMPALYKSNQGVLGPELVLGRGCLQSSAEPGAGTMPDGYRLTPRQIPSRSSRGRGDDLALEPTYNLRLILCALAGLGMLASLPFLTIPGLSGFARKTPAPIRVKCFPFGERAARTALAVGSPNHAATMICNPAVPREDPDFLCDESRPRRPSASLLGFVLLLSHIAGADAGDLILGNRNIS